MVTVDEQKETYSEWGTENLGEKTGVYLEMFELAHGY